VSDKRVSDVTEEFQWMVGMRARRLHRSYERSLGRVASGQAPTVADRLTALADHIDQALSDPWSSQTIARMRDVARSLRHIAEGVTVAEVSAEAFADKSAGTGFVASKEASAS
jgi:hypothetical protein